MDRNNDQPRKTEVPGSSLSARRAWIEMEEQTEQESTVDEVALRKESVDRNSCGDTLRPPALVALRKESVDRNVFLTLTVRNIPSRSPQGERG